jgi:hypothetical protein
LIVNLKLQLKRLSLSVHYVRLLVSLYIVSYGLNHTCSGELLKPLLTQGDKLICRRKLFGEDDEAGDEEELNQAAQDGENGQSIVVLMFVQELTR